MSDKRGFYILASSLTAIAVCLGILTAWERPREFIRAVLFAEKREILAKAQGDLNGRGLNIVAIKVKTADTLSVEIYDWNLQKTGTQFRSRIILPEKRDAFMNFRDNAVNLALADVDNDGNLEIIAPTFDENLIPRLNVYKYQESTQSFERMGPDSLKL
jgi:hypothetical protein